MPIIDWTHIAIHHSATPDDSHRLDFDNFRRYHLQDRGWQDVGYHWGIEEVELGIEIIVGRPETLTGAHAKGMNSKALGICFAGNFDLAPPSDELLRVATYRLIRPITLRYGIKPDNIIGHRDVDQLVRGRPLRSCPGDKFDLNRIRGLL